MAIEMTKHDKECSWAQEQAALHVYGELPDEQRHRLEQHVRGCEECGAELAAYGELREQMQLAAVREPSANLLASARMRLDEALDRAEMSGAGRAGRVGWLRQAASAWGFHLRAVPALATLLVVVGAGGGGVAGWQITRHAQARSYGQLTADGRFSDVDGISGAAVLTPASSNGANSGAAAAASLPEGIANISGVVTQPGSNMVEVRYNRMVPGAIEGTADDPKIQQLLLLATQNRANPGVRVDSVGLLADACHAGHDCEDARVRQALIYALRNDKNAGVRLKALDGLANYVATDEAVRNSVLQALLHDDNPGVRTEAIQMLSPVEADGSVREVLHTLANDDRNPYIRTVSQQALESGPEIQ
jgi:anti-sigma factor RsiW